ncbi:polysaccharide pyruvyl transferase family protein [Microbacterium sp. NPDC055683]
MLTGRDRSRLEALRARTRQTLLEAIGDVRDVALLDMPNQRNVGDSLIWAGEIAYLRDIGIRVAYTSDIGGYRVEDVRAAMPRGVVLLHGGGNFGDLWPGHQAHRERILAELPDYRIVQLPQSILFSSDESAARADAALAAHPDALVLLRDDESIERARVQLPSAQVRFCADMALGWDAPADAGPRRDGDVLVIARSDHESASGLAAVGRGWLGDGPVRVTDWGAIGGWAGVRWRIARAVTALDRRLVQASRRWGTPRLRIVHRLAEHAVARINEQNIRAAVALYAGSRLVVVDRLHAHVLACLLGIENIVLDNSYRKIGSVFDAYTGGFSTAVYASGVDDARSLVEGLVST